MRLHSFALLLVAALLASVEPVSAATSSQLTNSDTSTLVRPNQNDVPVVHRFLRADNTADESDEERVTNVKAIQDLNKLDEKIPSVKAIQGLNKVNEKVPSAKAYPDKLFELLNLNTGLDTILTSPRLNLWVKLVESFSTKDDRLKTPLIDTLRSYYNDKDLLRMFNQAKANEKTKKVATNLEAALVSQLRLTRFKNEAKRAIANPNL